MVAAKRRRARIRLRQGFVGQGAPTSHRQIGILILAVALNRENLPSQEASCSGLSILKMVSALQALGDMDAWEPGPALAWLASAQAVKWRAFSPRIAKSSH